MDDDGGADFTKIQDAINASSSGDTIFVYSGTYNENVYINKTLDIIGQDKYTTIIDGGGNYETVHIFIESVNLSNFTIRNGHEYGILLDNTHYTNLENLIIVNNSVEGIYSRSSVNCQILYCLIQDNNYGIYFDHNSRYINIFNNTFDNNIFGKKIEKPTRT